MLQTMRNLAQSLVFKALMVLLVVSFGIWGIGDIFRGNALRRHVAKIGHEAIAVQDLDRAFAQALDNARRQVSPDITRQQAIQMHIMDDMLANLIQRAGMDQEVQRLGINVSDEQFLKYISQMPKLKKEDGSFDRDTFRQMMEQARQQLGMSERQFIDQGRMQMAQQQIINALRSDTPVPHTISENLYRARGQKRVADVITIRDESFTDIPKPDEPTLRGFYEKTRDRYTTPEYRAITIARLSADDMAADQAVSDDEVRKAYEAQPAPPGNIERRDIIQVTVPDEAKGKELATAARASGDLSATAKKMGFDPLPVNRVEEKGLMPELTSKIFALNENGISDPISASGGWQLVQVKKIHPAEKPSFESQKDEIRKQLKHDMAVDRISNMVNQLDDELAGGHALEDIADTLKMRVVKIPAMDAQGKLPGGQDPAELPDREQVLRVAFAQASGEISPILDDKQGNYTVVRVDSITPAAIPPFDQVQSSVTLAWNQMERARLSGALAEEIAKGLREGKSASSFADRKGVSVRESKPVSAADDKDPDLSMAASQQILKMKKDEVSIVAGEHGPVVLRLAKLIDVDPAQDKYGVDHIADQIHDKMPEELVEQFAKYMRVLYPVEIDQDVLNNVKQQQMGGT